MLAACQNMCERMHVSPCWVRCHKRSSWTDSMLLNSRQACARPTAPATATRHHNSNRSQPCTCKLSRCDDSHAGLYTCHVLGILITHLKIGRIQRSQVAQECRRLTGLCSLGAMIVPLQQAGQDEALLGTSHAHMHQPQLLLSVTLCRQRLL